MACERCGVPGGLWIGDATICDDCAAEVCDPRDYADVPDGAYPWPADTIQLPKGVLT